MVIIMVMTKWMNNSHDGGRNGCSATGKHACIGQRDSVGSRRRVNEAMGGFLGNRGATDDNLQ